MKKEYDFDKGKKGAVISETGKTRITIYLDDGIVEEFRNRANRSGKGYQTLINDALREFLNRTEKSLDEETLRRILREELKKAS